MNRSPGRKSGEKAPRNTGRDGPKRVWGEASPGLAARL
jgi:hypothetical protein